MIIPFGKFQVQAWTNAIELARKGYNVKLERLPSIGWQVTVS